MGEPALAKSKAVAKRRRVKKKLPDEYADDNEVKKRLNEKFSKKKKSKDEDTAMLKVRIKQDKIKAKIDNSESHNNLIARAEESHCSKQYQIEWRTDTLSSLWKCAICGIRSNRESTGDLFGPYYVRITTDHWPHHLVKKPAKITRRDEPWMDTWLHGDCALWLDCVQMEGSQLRGLEEALNKAWGEKCFLCNGIGAHINGSNQRLVHYPCALKQGWNLDTASFLCTLPKPI